MVYQFGQLSVFGRPSWILQQDYVTVYVEMAGFLLQYAWY